MTAGITGAIGPRRVYLSAMLHVLYENESWLPPLAAALDARALPWTPVHVVGGIFDPLASPPPGVFVNRMSPSAHTRGNGGGVRFVHEYLPYLEQHGRRVVNGARSFALEVSKARQHAALHAAGILTPPTIAVVGREALSAAARRVGGPLLTKHNQGGKGLGVRLFTDVDELDAYVSGDAFEEPFDGVTLVQRYIAPREPYITRVEIVDGRFLYALRASTEAGFQLCPADACAVERGVGDAFCPVGGSGRFAVSPLTEADPLVQAYLAFCRTHTIDAAGIEFVEDGQGRRYTYDVNMNTNYNSDVEAAVGLRGMDAWAAMCARLLADTDHS